MAFRAGLAQDEELALVEAMHNEDFDWDNWYDQFERNEGRGEHDEDDGDEEEENGGQDVD